jgi:hypothetical protein
MYRVVWLSAVVLALLAAAPSPLHGQSEPPPAQPPLVVFIEESRQLDMASVTVSGPNGLSELAAIFRQLGARTQFARLREPLPEDVSVIVLVRPRRPLPVDYLARIWTRVEQGANLLLAFDPSGHVRASPEAPTSGLARLLALEYGTPLFAGMLIQPWFTKETVARLETSFLPALPYPVSNPVNAPLVAYDLPIMTWGARHVGAELFGVDSTAFPLAYANAAFAETNARALNPANTDPLEVNYGADAVGRLTIGAVGENSRTNTRVALLGDGEMLMNGFGLAFTSTAQGQLPLYPGNRVLAQQIAAWLLRVSPENALPLPSGFTWVAVDGEPNDWDDSRNPPIAQGESMVNVMSLRIQQARAFRNDSYLYVMIETMATPNPDVQVEFGLDSRGSGTADVFMVANRSGVFLRGADDSPTRLRDADFAVGSVIEVRIPLRAAGLSSALPQMCLTTATPLAFPTPPDCMAAPIPISNSNERDPADLHIQDEEGLMLTTRTNDTANIRSAPSTSASVVVGLRNGRLLRAVGRNSAGDWVQVENARYTGWISRLVFNANGDVMTLPVVEGT